MNFYFRFGLIAAFLIGCLGGAKAQYITIPDPIFVSWLQSHGYSGCMTGNQLDTSCPTVLNAISIVCEANGISDFTGIEAFVNLEELYCGNNQFTSLPSLPASLITLSCHHSQLTTLPSLPASLQNLICYNSPLTSLPNLPSSLTSLWCSNNQFTSLPNLPASLASLRCDHNQLVTLPSLPASLIYLDCNFNQLSALPSLPPLLTSLSCRYNQLSTLPSLPASLNELYCIGNQLTTLPSLPAFLTYLDCSDNQLTTLPSLPASLTGLRCVNNQLTGLPTLPTVMYELNISNNPGITCLPPIQEITGVGSIAGTSITCLPNVIQHSGFNPSIDTLPVCGLFNTNNCQVAYNIEGKIYRDDNSNCALDSGEQDLNNIKVLLHQGGNVIQQVFSNINGSYSFLTNLGAFETSIDTNGLPFNVTCPADNNYNSILIVADSMDYNLNFALQCKPGYDVGVWATVPVGMFFPGQTTSVIVKAGDVVSNFFSGGCNTTGLSGTVTATLNGPVTVSGASGNGVVSGNTITWNVVDFSLVNPDTAFLISIVTDTSAQVGEQACVTVIVAANTGTDNNPQNNTLTHCFNVVNSFDPNVKEVYPSTGIIPGEWHTYTIHFQNTGTAAAQHILVKDTLDQNLDWNSFQLLAYSHDNLTQVLNNGIVHFNFPNINLPDSTSDEPNSHGWIQYKIKTDSTITPGTTIHNTAAIYFDFNDPIITNDALVTYCTPVETQQMFTICEGDSVQVNNQWLHQGGVYTNLYTASTGCDSTVTTTLVVNPTVAFIEIYTLCPGDSVTVNGEVYHQAVSFTDTAIGTNGCNVLLITNVVESNVNATVALNNDTLSAAAGMESYQWIDCDAGQPISGATAQIFAPTQNGYYAVMVTANDACTEISECIEVLITGIDNFASNAFTITPNPASQIAIVRTQRLLHQGELRITDITGRTVQNIIHAGTETHIDLNGLMEGTYFMQLRENGKPVNVQKLVKMQ